MVIQWDFIWCNDTVRTNVIARTPGFPHQPLAMDESVGDARAYVHKSTTSNSNSLLGMCTFNKMTRSVLGNKNSMLHH